MMIQNIDEFHQSGWRDEDLKIITHNGTFHSDEIFAIALLLKFELKESQHVQIVRSRDEVFLTQYIDYADVFIVDIGGSFQPELCNFDHHQDDNYFADKASVRLIHDYLLNTNKLTPELGKHLWENLIMLINRWDLGQEQNYVNYFHRPLPSLISSYNRSTEDLSRENIQFKKALQFALEIVENESFSYFQYQDAKRTFNKHRNINSHTILFEDFNPKHSSFLKQHRNIRYYIYPYRGNWAVAAVNSKKHPIPECPHHEGLVFSHKNHFLTVFSTKEFAIRFMEPHFQGKI